MAEMKLTEARRRGRLAEAGKVRSFGSEPGSVSFAWKETKMIKTLFIAVGIGTTLTMMAAETQKQPVVGETAPDFSLTTGNGSQVSLKDYRGKWVVLYFYPKDFTSGCTMEARNFQRDLAKYHQDGAVILGVSVDTAQSHKSFCAKEGLNFKLLADPTAKVSTEYGSTMQHEGKTYAARNTFLVNPEGKIVKVYIHVNPADHSEQVLKDLAELKKNGT
jgi:peroxiredoxin Q/BCP